MNDFEYSILLNGFEVWNCVVLEEVRYFSSTVFVFTPEVANSAVKQAKDNENIAKEDPPETPNQSEAVVKGDDKVASDADGAKANQAAPMKAESNSGSFANEVDKDAAVERALFNTIKNTGSEMVEASADSKFASSLNGSDKRKLSDLNSLNFYTSGQLKLLLFALLRQCSENSTRCPVFFSKPKIDISIYLV